MSGPVFTILGDSNVRRFLSSVNKRACPDIEASQILTCMKAPLFPEALSQIKDESDAVVVACVTNFITDSKGSSTVSARVEPVIVKFMERIIGACELSPGRTFLVCPPMFRSNPGWYREGLSEILTKFSAVFSGSSQANLKLMPRLVLLAVTGVC